MLGCDVRSDNTLPPATLCYQVRSQNVNGPIFSNFLQDRNYSVACRRFNIYCAAYLYSRNNPIVALMHLVRDAALTLLFERFFAKEVFCRLFTR